MRKVREVEVKVGDRLHYSGDVCNHRVWATVTEVKGNHVVIEFDEGGSQPIPVYIIGDVYHGHCDPRFVTEAAYKDWHARKLEELREQLGEE